MCGGGGYVGMGGGGGGVMYVQYVPKHIYYCVVFIGFLGVPAFYIG